MDLLKPIKQLWRQPLKMLAGILLITMAVAVLCVCLAQTMAADQTAQRLNESFVSIALPSSISYEGSGQFMENMVADHPEIFLGEYRHGLASAYIPSLQMDHFQSHLHITQNLTDNYLYLPRFRSYSGAMLELTVTGYESTLEGYTLYGVVDQVLGLAPGYQDPTNYRVIISSEEDLFPGLSVSYGQRCIVYTNQYEDLDWMLRSTMMEAGRVLFWGQDMEIPYWNMRAFIAEVYGNGASGPQHLTTTDFFRYEHGSYRLKRIKCQLGDLITYVDAQTFQTIRLTVDHPMSDPTVPGIRLLSQQTGQEFLSSGEGEAWRKALEDIVINYQTFPIIGVDRLDYVADFCRNVTRITEGRNFTEEELLNGEKVCILSKEAAQRNGLSVGDTLDMRFYDSTDSTYSSSIANGEGTMAPTALRFASEHTSWTGELEGYTIVGLYEQNYQWNYPDENFYGFTENTIFMPKSAVPSQMEESIHGMFCTWIIDNEKLLQLQSMTQDAGFDGVFSYFDNGYNAIAQSLSTYDQAAKLILPLGAAVYAMIMLLFLCLFPLRQGTAVAMLDSLGAGFVRKSGFVIHSTLGILLPGFVAGTAISVALWENLAKALMDFVETNVELTLAPESLWIASGIQLALVMGITGLITLPMVIRANLMKR